MMSVCVCASIHYGALALGMRRDDQVNEEAAVQGSLDASGPAKLHSQAFIARPVIPN